jgi:hypothetical protein
MSMKHKIIKTRKQSEREEYIYFRSDSVKNKKKSNFLANQ